MERLMFNITGQKDKKDFIIAQRRLHAEVDFVQLIPHFLIVAAPEDTSVSEMKDILEKTGEYDASKWHEYKVVPSDQWDDIDNWYIPNQSSDKVDYWAIKIRDEEDILNCLHEPASHGTTYDELIGRFNDEKRITLRLPWSLHVALSRASTGTTLNSFCIQTLADAVGSTELVKEFEVQREAQRRKPGRPKKVQDSE